MNLRDQNCERDYKTVEEESDHVSYDFANEEKAVYNIHFLPELHFLHIKTETKHHQNSEQILITCLTLHS
jgi:hypothetical protein